jgi:2-oxoisovalerate dehydrogenase E1 component beta subunit
VDDASDMRPVDKIKPTLSRVAPELSSDEEPSLGRSNLLLNTDDKALATPGLVFSDGHGLRGPTGKGRQTRRMNLYQSVRDALG